VKRRIVGVAVGVAVAPPCQCLASQEIRGESYLVIVTSVFVDGLQILIDFENEVNYSGAVERRRFYPLGQSLPKPRLPP
jgi:hypothetical protein